MLGLSSTDTDVAPDEGNLGSEEFRLIGPLRENIMAMIIRMAVSRTMAIHAHLHALSLDRTAADRYEQRPWTSELTAEGFSGRVQVANPVSFMVRKLLIRRAALISTERGSLPKRFERLAPMVSIRCSRRACSTKRLGERGSIVALGRTR